MDKKREKICPRCRTVFSEDLSVCPNDATVLEPKPVDKFIGRIIDNRYKILEVIGEGGWGIVYKAYQESVDRYLAIKTIKSRFLNVPDVISNFFKEAKAISKLKHHNTITLHNFGETEDHILYMVMEFLEGETLNKLIYNEGAIDVKKAVYLISQTCDSLDEAHRNSIIHSDLKPGNIFLARGFARPDFVKVLDFGISKMLGDQSDEKEDVVLGTPKYMSPEQIMGDEVLPSSDIYSLGVILFEILTGRPPFTDANSENILKKHIHQKPPSLAGINPRMKRFRSLQNIVLSCLAKNRDDRPQSAHELKRLLINSILKEEEVEEEKESEFIDVSSNIELAVSKGLRPLKQSSFTPASPQSIAYQKNLSDYFDRSLLSSRKKQKFSGGNILKSIINSKVALLIGTSVIILTGLFLYIKKEKFVKFTKQEETGDVNMSDKIKTDRQKTDDFLEKLKEREKSAGLQQHYGVFEMSRDKTKNAEDSVPADSKKVVSIRISSFPDKATVEIDGLEIGKTPVLWTVPVDKKIRIDVTASDGRKKTVQLDPSQQREVFVRF
jgi:serine/threonine protein kinase